MRAALFVALAMLAPGSARSAPSPSKPAAEVVVSLKRADGKAIGDGVATLVCSGQPDLVRTIKDGVLTLPATDKLTDCVLSVHGRQTTHAVGLPKELRADATLTIGKKAVAAAPKPMARPATPSSEVDRKASGTISGVVHDPDTKKKIPDALVILQCTCLSGTRETKTNRNGLYAFRHLPPGTYTVQVLAGTADVSKVTTLPRGAKFRANFKVSPDSAHKRVVRVKAVPVEAKTSVGRTVSMEEFRNIPLGSTSRDYASVVESSATASRDAAGISVAGSAGTETRSGRRSRRKPRGAKRPGRRRAGKSGKLARAETKTAPARAAETGRRRAKQQQWARQLTAGAVDDVDAPNAFHRYLATVSDRVPLRDAFAGPHRVLQVTDQHGLPVAGAVVTLGGRTYRSRRDGRVVFIPGWDATGNGHLAEVPNAGTSMRATLEADVTRVILPKSIEPPTPKVDLALVIDTTGSMGDELEYIKAELGSLLASLRADYPKLDIRWGLVLYRDSTDTYVTRRVDFTRDFEEFSASLAGERASGGGDAPEAVHAAFRVAQTLQWRDASAAGRVLVHIADAPPHTQHVAETLAAVDVLRRDGTAIYPVAGSGVDETAEFTMRTSALMSGGQYVFLTDDSGIGGSHREATAACFRVDSLISVLGKILEAELEGRRAKLPQGNRGSGCQAQ